MEFLSYQIKWVGEDQEPNQEPNQEPKNKTYSQAEFDKHMAGLRRKNESQVEAMSKELETLKERSNLTTQERADLETRLETLKEESMTKEQKLNKQLKKVDTEWANKFKTLEEKHNDLSNRYENETINRAITNAAIDGDAFSPEQIVAILRPTTQLIPELGENKEPTGNLLTIANFTGIDEEGNTVTEKLPVQEAVKRMREMPEKYGNLFKSDSSSGVGRGNSNNNTDDDAKYSGDMNSFMRRRKKER